MRIALLVIFFWTNLSLTLTQDLRFQHYTMDDGVSYFRTPEDANIMQDRQGYIWFPTFNGINRFDGKTFRVFRYEKGAQTGLSSNVGIQLTEDEQGRIWMGMGKTGVCIFDPLTERFQYLYHDPDDPNSLTSSFTRSVTRDREGNMWIKIWGKGVCCVDPKTLKCKRYQQVVDPASGEHLTINSCNFLVSEDGSRWLFTQFGLCRYRVDQDAFVLQIRHAFPWRLELVEVAPGILYFFSRQLATPGCINLQTGAIGDLPAPLVAALPDSIEAVCKDRDGVIWFGGRDKLLRYDPATQKTRMYHYSLEDPWSVPKGRIFAIFQDKAGSLWLLSDACGIAVAHTLHNPFQKLNMDVLDVLTLDSDHTLLATSKGILTYKISEQSVVPSTLPERVTSARAAQLKLSSKKDLWWWDDVKEKTFSYNLETGKYRELDFGQYFELDSRGNVWFANMQRMYDVGREQLVDVRREMLKQDSSFSIPSNPTMFISVAVDRQDRIWYGTDQQGLVVFDPASRTYRHYQGQPGLPNPLSVNTIHRLLAASNGWIYQRTGTTFSVYQPERDTFLDFTEKDGLPSIELFSMVEDVHGHIWLGTARGLSRLSIPDFRFHNFTEVDGLPYDIFERMQGTGAAGNIYLKKGGKSFRFHPDSVKQHTFTAPVTLTDFYISYRKIEIGAADSLLPVKISYLNKLDLSYDQNDFGFGFISLNFFKPKQIRYFYKLENFDENWIDAGIKNEVHYTNIPPGRYVFKVKAQTEAGFWTPRETTIAIRIRPPWWQTWWAYLLYGLLFIAVLAGLRQYELRRLNIQAEARRLRELDALKSRLYTNISHEFRTPLTVIIGMSGEIGNQPKAAQNLILRNARSLLRLVNQMLDLEKLENGKLEIRWQQGDIIAYLNYLLESFQSYAASKQIRMTFEAAHPKLVMAYDAEKLQHIVANLLSNAIKFTSEGGAVHFGVAVRGAPPADRELVLTVRDTGIGIPPEEQANIFDRFYQVSGYTRKGEGSGIGLAFTKELVGLLEGRISVDSAPGTGTEFQVVLPMRGESGPGGEVKTIAQDVSNPVPEMEWPVPDAQPALPDSGDAATDIPLLLIIEDNADVAHYIRSCLHGRYAVRWASDGRAGIDQALEAIPDVIVCDVMMPEKDGFEVTAFLKNDERTSHIPIVLLTARADVESRIAGLQRGADAYLAKPFDKTELLVRLDMLIELRRKLQARYSNPELLAALAQAAHAGPDIQPEDAFLTKVNAMIEQHLTDSDYDVPHLCRDMYISRPQLYRKIKALTDRSIASYMRLLRLLRAKALLQEGEMSVTEVAYAAGFSDPAYFSRAFSEEFGVAPRELRGGLS